MKLEIRLLFLGMALLLVIAAACQRLGIAAA